MRENRQNGGISSALKELSGDYRLRSVVMTVPGMGINLIYALLNGIVGIVAGSAWYGSLSAYYLLLCIMRAYAVLYARQQRSGTVTDPALREWQVYRRCGILVAFMSLALGGAAVMLEAFGASKSYPGFLIYGIAAYTFYKVIMSVRHLVRARKENSLLLITLRDIGHVDSLVSLLSLQIALNSTFGGNGNFEHTSNFVTACVVCAAALVMGVSMVRDAGKRRKSMQK